jgi:hypothetical protein
MTELDRTQRPGVEVEGEAVTAGSGVDGVRRHKARYGLSLKSALEKTAPLELGETVLLDAGVQHKTGRHSARPGFLRLTDRRLLIYFGAMLSSGRVVEVPRQLIRGVEEVVVGVPFAGGKRRAILIAHDDQTPQEQVPFWAFDLIRASVMSGAGRFGAALGRIDKQTETLYYALCAGLNQSTAESRPRE